MKIIERVYLGHPVNLIKISSLGVFMIKTSILALFSLLFMIFHADLVTKGAAAGLLLWYSAVVPALFPFLRSVSRRMVCSPHRAPLRLSYGRKNVCGLSRGKAAQLQ